MKTKRTLRTLRRAGINPASIGFAGYTPTGKAVRRLWRSRFVGAKMQESLPMTPAELKTLRAACGLSLPHLAALSGVQERTARYWESGQTIVPADVSAMITQLDAQLSQAAQQGVSTVTDYASAHPGQKLADVVLIRYKTDADLHRFRPDMRGLPTTSHAAIIYRARSLLARSGIPCRIVFMDPDDYINFRGLRQDTESTRAEWAALQIPESHL